MTRIGWIAGAVLALLVPAVAAAQERIETPGTIDHPRAGTGFPERIGEFRRVNATSFDKSGDNLGASYDLARPGGRLLISIYIYPAASFQQETGSAETDRAVLCRQEFQAVRQAIEQAQQNPVVVEPGPAAAVPGTEAQLSHRVVYRFRTRLGEEVREVRSEARLYCHVGGWQVKYRATAPVELDANAAIDTFIRLGPWPGRAPASGNVAALAGGGATVMLASAPSPSR